MHLLGNNHPTSVRLLERDDERVRIRGPAGESFGKPTDLIEMLRKYRGKYDVKKVFTEGNEISIWYNLDTSVARAFMASWYEVKDGRIVSIQTLFDPRAFGTSPKRSYLSYASL